LQPDFIKRWGKVGFPRPVVHFAIREPVFWYDIVAPVALLVIVTLYLFWLDRKAGSCTASKRIEMVDADIDNKSRGSLSHRFKGTPKIDIRTDHGLDQFIGMVLDNKAQTVLADLGAGSTKETY
jgi:hypothetical protein